MRKKDVKAAVGVAIIEEMMQENHLWLFGHVHHIL